MRFHLLALPNAQTTRAYSLCGFAMCTIRFAQLLKSLGHTVILYASEENEAPCDELVTVVTKEEIATIFAIDGTEYQYAHIDAMRPTWQLANQRAIQGIARRKQPRDFICQIGGSSQQAVSDAHPDLMCVEYSIGYTGSFSKYRVFESHAWRHCTYGFQNSNGFGGFDMDGRHFDDVIPCFFDPADFPFQARAEDFVLYAGRLIERKGIGIACAAAREAGVPLKVVGHGDPRLVTYGEYLGALPMAERNAWMSRARAVLTPTIYVEPFNCVAVEAQFCGAPVIAPNFGGFTETVVHGETGFRCSYLGEFVAAIDAAGSLDRRAIRARAERTYSIRAVARSYQAYFDRLMLLWGDGFNTVHGREGLVPA